MYLILDAARENVIFSHTYLTNTRKINLKVDTKKYKSIYYKKSLIQLQDHYVVPLLYSEGEFFYTNSHSTDVYLNEFAETNDTEHEYTKILTDWMKSYGAKINSYFLNLTVQLNYTNVHVSKELRTLNPSLARKLDGIKLSDNAINGNFLIQFLYYLFVFNKNNRILELMGIEHDFSSLGSGSAVLVSKGILGRYSRLLELSVGNEGGKGQLYVIAVCIAAVEKRKKILSQLLDNPLYNIHKDAIFELLTECNESKLATKIFLELKTHPANTNRLLEAIYHNRDIESLDLLMENRINVIEITNLALRTAVASLNVYLSAKLLTLGARLNRPEYNCINEAMDPKNDVLLQDIVANDKILVYNDRPNEFDDYREIISFLLSYKCSSGYYLHADIDVDIIEKKVYEGDYHSLMIILDDHLLCSRFGKKNDQSFDALLKISQIVRFIAAKKTKNNQKIYTGYCAEAKKSFEILKEFNKNASVLNDGYYNALLRRIEMKRDEITKLLLNHKVNLTNSEYNGLVAACKLNRIDLVMALVNQGAKVSDMGSKLIEIACNNNNQQLVEYLVAKGAVLNKSLPGNIHCDGIVSACKNNNSTMAKYLLDHGAKLGRFGADGIVEACKNNNYVLVRHLLDSGVKFRSESGSQSESSLSLAFKHACINGNIDIVRLLLSSGVQLRVGGRNMYGVCEAIKNNNIELLKLLLESGANTGHLEEVDIDNAIINNNPELLKLILAGGCNLKAINYIDFTAACRTKNIEIVEMLIENGVDPSRNCCYNGVYEACQNNDVELVRLLFASGAMLCNHKKSCVVEAINNKNKELFFLLIQRVHSIKADRVNGIRDICEANSLEYLQLFLEYTGIKTLKEYKYNGIVECCRNNNLEMLKKLYIHGARIIDQRLNGVNEACRNNNFEMLAFLLESRIGANLSDEWYNGVNVACTENNFTLLRYLVNNRGATLSNGYCNGVKAAAKSDNYEMIKFLVENGAKIDVFRNSGISEAVQNSNIEILEYLLTNCEPSDGRHYTSLMYKAKKTGDMSLLEYLINYSHGNSDIDQSSLIFGLQELATAVVEGNRSVLTYFLENSCCHDRELNSVLIDACNLNDIETVKLLLEHGVGFGDSQYACLFAAMNPNVDTGNDCRGEASQLVDVVMSC